MIPSITFKKLWILSFNWYWNDYFYFYYVCTILSLLWNDPIKVHALLENNWRYNSLAVNWRLNIIIISREKFLHGPKRTLDHLLSMQAYCYCSRFTRCCSKLSGLVLDFTLFLKLKSWSSAVSSEHPPRMWLPRSIQEIAESYLHVEGMVLFWWGGHCCPMHCNRFKIYCGPPNLGITRTWICRLKLAQRPIFSGLRFFNEPEISDSGPPS